MKKHDLPQKRFRLSRRWVVTSIIIVIVLLLAGVWFYFSLSYASTTNKAIQDQKKSLTTAIEKEKGSFQGGKLNKKIAALTTVSAAIKNPPCKSELSWWQFAPAYDPAAARCADYLASSGQFRAELDKALQLLQYEAALSTVLHQSTQSDANTDLSIEQRLQQWQSSQTVIEKMAVPADGQAFADETKKRVNAIVSAWRNINETNKAKNEQKYREAAANLQKAYDAFQKQSDSFKQLLENTQNKLIATFSEIP